MLSLIPLALTVAPELAKLMFGTGGKSIAQAMAQAVQQMTGTSDPSKAQALLVADPDMNAKLRVELLKAGNDAQAALLADVASARGQTVSLAQNQSPIAWGAPSVSVLVLVAFAASVGVLVYHAVPDANGQLLDVIVGSLATMAVNVVGYWVGSSAGSARKTDLLAAAHADTASLVQRTYDQPMTTTTVATSDATVTTQTAPIDTDSGRGRGSETQPPPAPLAQAVQAAPVRPAVPKRSAFFDHVRETIFGGHLVQSQVEGCEAILDFWSKTYPTGDMRHLAYALATACWETGRTMQPIEEYGRGAGHPYAVGGWYGRGFVQLTWEDNYRKLGAAIGEDLVAHPAKALETPTALKILFTGMLEGLFTGKKLGDVLNNTSNDPIAARTVVNGSDHADEVATLHSAFLAALASER